MEKPKYSISSEAIANGINDLLDEKEELQDRINKAIEYIENEIPYLLEIESEDEDINGNYVYTYKEYTGIDKLLDILKGSDKE